MYQCPEFLGTLPFPRPARRGSASSLESLGRGPSVIPGDPKCPNIGCLGFPYKEVHLWTWVETVFGYLI